jgi:hypothetical protein
MDAAASATKNDSPVVATALAPSGSDRAKIWQPLKLLARFRERFGKLTRRNESLPVERQVETPVESIGLESAVQYACDIAYVCADATPAEALVRERMASADSTGERNALAEVYQRLCAIYSVGGSIPHRLHVHKMVRQTLPDEREDRVFELVEFLAGPLNDALCREQALGWIAQLGLKLHLYGNGWQRHPELGRYMQDFARDDELTSICRSAKINLRLTRVDVNDPVLSTGIQSGGFFLMRFFTDDVIERIYRPLHAFCRQQGIRNDEQLRQRARSSTMAQRLLTFADKTLGMNVFEIPGGLVPELHRLSADGFSRFPGARFNSEYDRVSFASREQLMTLINRYLDDAPERRRIAGAMRRALVERREPHSNEQAARAEAHRAAQPLPAGEVAA